MFFCSTRNQDLIDVIGHPHPSEKEQRSEAIPKFIQAQSRGNHPELSEFRIFVVRTMVFLQVGSMPQPMHHGLQLCPKVGLNRRSFFFENWSSRHKRFCSVFSFCTLYSMLICQDQQILINGMES